MTADTIIAQSTGDFIVDSGLTFNPGANTLSVLADGVSLVGNIAAAGETVIIAPNTAGNQMRVGTNPGDANTTEVGSGEIDRITAGTLQLGDSNAGAVVVTADIAPAGTNTLDLRSGAVVTATAGAIAETNLAVVVSGASANSDLSNANNDVDVFAGNAGGRSFTFVDRDGFSVGTVGTVVGIGTGRSTNLTATTGNITIDNAITAARGGTITASAADALITVNDTINISAGTGTRFMSLVADRIDLNAALSSANNESHTWSVRSSTAGRAINLGSTVDNTANTLELSAAEVALIQAENVVIGDANAGNITVSQDITFSTPTQTIRTNRLVTGGSVTATTGSGGGIIAANGTAGANNNKASLSVEAGGAITITEASTNIDSLAAFTTTGNIAVTDTNGFTVNTQTTASGGAVIAGVDSNAGSVTLTTGGALTVSNTTSANDIEATGAINLIAGANELVQIAAGADVESSGGEISLHGDKMDIAGTITNTGRQVTLRSMTAGDAIHLGVATDATADTLELSNAELARVTADTTVIGHTSAGAVDVTAALNSPASTLKIISGSTVGTSATIDGNFNLTIDAATNDVTFNSDVGGTTALNTIDIIGRNITSSLLTKINATAMNFRAKGAGQPLAKVVLEGTVNGIAGAAAAQEATVFGPLGPGPFTFNSARISGAPAPATAAAGRKRIPRAHSVARTGQKPDDESDRDIFRILFPQQPKRAGAEVTSPHNALRQNGENDRFLIDPYEQEYRLIRMNQEVSQRLGGRDIIIDLPLWQQFSAITVPN
ncbi:MAG: hypothetical protein OQJ97_18565 [Rhodospirillales bacterium]|nr:hypothetical protein [Rhodospirillales bacterium]